MENKIRSSSHLIRTVSFSTCSETPSVFFILTFFILTLSCSQKRQMLKIWICRSKYSSEKLLLWKQIEDSCSLIDILKSFDSGCLCVCKRTNLKNTLLKISFFWNWLIIPLHKQIVKLLSIYIFKFQLKPSLAVPASFPFHCFWLSNLVSFNTTTIYIFKQHYIISYGAGICLLGKCSYRCLCY